MRDIPVGNGKLLVNFDNKYQIRDIYFPHVGQENHTEGFPFRFGVWVDGEFSWTFADGWSHSLGYLPETLVTDVTLTNEALGIQIRCNDTVASHDNVFLRRVRVIDLNQTAREVRVFLHHDFRIYENKVGDTAYYDPDASSLIHYKKHRYFLINTLPHFDQFATGRKAFHDKEGTWRDAEDGILSYGAITEGSVDSTIGVSVSLEPDGVGEFFYWIAFGTSRDTAVELNERVLEKGPMEFLDYSENYWRAWVNKNDTDFLDLPEIVVDFFKRCLLVVTTQIDSDGAILAANDSDVTYRATDHYSYLWTRDGAFVANALDLAGFAEKSRAFFEFCGKIVGPEGYFLQKYNPDGTVASGWHAAWDPGSRTRLVPIQEDETALVIWALWEHYDNYRDIDFAHRLYPGLVVKCADFMVAYRDERTGLPNPSWNLWEDRRGIHTFTCSTVVAGLRAAAKFARLFAEMPRADVYEQAADEIVAGMVEHMYSRTCRRFARAISIGPDGSIEIDTTVDASLIGTFYFKCFEPDDERVVSTIEAVKTSLQIGTGLARFENDGYMRRSLETPGNAWFICTLWLADHVIATASSIADLEPAMKILVWCIGSALPSGILSEQLDPQTNEQVSVSPLTWSHSTFIATVMRYLEKLRELSISPK
jgi:oligosaccharide amylase